jgi:hypothetical protein
VGLSHLDNFGYVPVLPYNLPKGTTPIVLLMFAFGGLAIALLIGSWKRDESAEATESNMKRSDADDKGSFRITVGLLLVGLCVLYSGSGWTRPR